MFENENNERIDLNKEERINYPMGSAPTFSVNNNTFVQSTPFAVLKKQNRLLKYVCGGLAACFVLMTCISGYSLLHKTESNIFLANTDNRPAAIVTVQGEGSKLTAEQIYNKYLDSVVAIKTEIVTRNIFNQTVSGAAAGSGFIISSDGYILTNYHVIEKANTITVTLADGSECEATIVGSEEENDIAVLKIDSEKTLNPVVLGDSDKMSVGEEVVAIGNPLGELTFSMTKGIVSALDREISTDLYSSINMFQVDCAVNEGNSGGPIFNMYGEVIGIVSAKYASNTIEGLGFCIPINDVANVVTDLIEFGKVVDKAYMGVTVSDVSNIMVSQYNMVNGAYVASVEENSCADKAGLKIGDIIVELEGKKVTNVNSLLAVKRSYKAGDIVNLKVWRSGEYIDISLTFDEYKEDVKEDIEEPIQPTENYNERSYEHPFNFDMFENYFY